MWVVVLIVVIALVSWYRWDRRYRGASSPGEDARFEPTDEVSIDPRTGEKTRVYSNPKTGERQYRREA